MEKLENIIPAAKSYVKYQTEFKSNDLIFNELSNGDLKDDEVIYPVVSSPLIVSSQKDKSNLK
jgi:hypothetical protein